MVVVSINGSATELRIRRLSDGGLLLVLGSRSHTAYAKDVSAGLRMVIDGKTCLFPKECVQLAAACAVGANVFANVVGV